MLELSIQQIRNLTGALSNNYFFTTDRNREGTWYYDSSDITSADNTGTVLVTSDGKRIVRLFNGDVEAQWFCYADGSTNDRDNMLASINYAIANDLNLFLGKYSYLIDGNLTVDGEINITGNNATLFSATQRAISILSLKQISGITFNKVRLTIDEDLNSYLEIINNSFIGNDKGIHLFLANQRWPRNVRIENNYFSGNSYAIYGGITDGLISNNIIINSTNRNIELSAGERTIIKNNRITGGVTGITQLCMRDVTGKQVIGANTIEGNIISNINEEAISIDCHGNTATQSSSVISGTVVSVTTTGPSKDIVPSFSIPAYEYLSYYVVFITGNNQKIPYQISYMGASGTQYLRIPAPTNNIQAGDEFVVVLANVGGIIQNNIIVNPASGISLWGNGYQTQIINNVIKNATTNGIKITSITGLAGGDYGPSEHNTVAGNTLISSKLTISLQKYGDGSNYYSSNFVYNNTIVDGNLTYAYQEALNIQNNLSTAVVISNLLTSVPDVPVNTIVSKVESGGDFEPYTKVKRSGTDADLKIGLEGDYVQPVGDDDIVITDYDKGVINYAPTGEKIRTTFTVVGGNPVPTYTIIP